MTEARFRRDNAKEWKSNVVLVTLAGGNPTMTVMGISVYEDSPSCTKPLEYIGSVEKLTLAEVCDVLEIKAVQQQSATGIATRVTRLVLPFGWGEKPAKYLQVRNWLCAAELQNLSWGDEVFEEYLNVLDPSRIIQAKGIDDGLDLQH